MPRLGRHSRILSTNSLPEANNRNSHTRIMNVVDSHSHLYCDAFDADRAQTVKRAQEAGVIHVVLPNEKRASLPLLHDMKRQFPGFVSLSIGLHPEEIHDDYQQELNILRAELENNRQDYVAVGEVGIDLYWDKTFRTEQMDALEQQLNWCLQYSLPFIIHCRDAMDEIVEVMEKFRNTSLQGVFHSFTGTPADVARLRQIGDFYFGVNGIVTFKKSSVKEILPHVGLERLLVETDSPYLAPVPHRGKRNESAFVVEVVKFVAKEMVLETDVVAHATTQNAKNLFGLKV